jgi:hypothetical protein
MTMPEETGLTPRIEQALDAVRSIYLRSCALRGCAKVAGIACGLVLLLFVADNVIALPAAVRLALAAGFALMVVAVAWRDLLRPLVSDIPPEACALLLEKRFPDLDARLINSLLLARRPLTSLGGRVVRVTMNEADGMVRRFNFPAFFEGKKILRIVLAGGALLAVMGVYAVVFPAYFGNAFIRYASPLGGHAHLRGPKLIVTPGDVTLRPGEELTVRATVQDALPEKALLEKGESSFAMSFDGQAFVFRFPPIQEERFTYRVVTAESKSPRYTVVVAKPPAVAGLRLRYDFPAYSGLAARFEERATGDVRCLAGTAVTVTATADKPLARGFLDVGGTRIAMELRNETRVEGSFTVTAKGTYAILVVGKEHGLEGGADRTYAIDIVPDQPPAVAFLKPPAGARFRPGAPLEVVVRGTDDLGVAQLVLLMAERERAPWHSVQAWNGEKGKLVVQENLALYPKKGDLILKGVAKDFLGQESATEPLHLKALTAEEVKETELSAISNAAQSLRRILELQQALLDRTRAAFPGGEKPAILLLGDGQEKILQASRELLAVWDRSGFSAADRLRFDIVVRTDMAEVVRLFREGATAPDARPSLSQSAERQTKIISIIASILDSLNELAQKVKNFEAEKLPSLAERVARRKEELESLRAELSKFMEEQKNVIASSEKLVGKRVDDFTAEDKSALKDLAEAEEKWAGVVQARAAEYAKLGAQDFADSTLVDELVEAYSELEKAAAALKAREIELAVPLEQSGLELAEELKSNIERWLGTPDKIKWSMEDPVADVEVPLADLPSELEDLVGELVDQEEEMTDDVEDVTSGWLDSMDEGAGWDAMDGPISNMSAKGITGNLLPNKNEVGGRSGEGRSGQSHGQIVEKEATGKGGRPTPTRVTPDAFEAGQVKDSSTDPTSGSTGGGKLAGTAPEGLRGPPSPDVAEKLRGLAAKQSQIRTEAERMDRRLRTLRFNPDHLTQAINTMRAMEDVLLGGERGNIARLHERVVTNLRRLEADVAGRAGSGIESGGPAAEAERDGMANAGDEAVPEAYEGLVREYREALTRGSR